MEGFGGPPGMLPMGHMMGPPMGMMHPGMPHPGMMGFPPMQQGPDGPGGPGMEGPAWKRQRLDADKGDGPAGGSRQDSIFYKTRMCIKWQEGRCTFGDRCNYAHGEAELRPLAPEGYEILEKREQRRLRQEAEAAATEGRSRDSSLTPAAGPGPPPSGPPPASRPANGPPDAKPPAGPRGSGSHLPLYKTKLCARFMAGGDCARGDACSFAHGPQELRSPPGGPMPPGGAMPPPGPMMPEAAMMMGMPPAGMMILPGMMVPPGMMGGMPRGPPGMMGPPMPPRPPPGAPPPPQPPAGPPPPRGQMSSLAAAKQHEVPMAGPASQLSAPDVAPLERARAMCLLLGLSKDGGKDMKPAALAAAKAAIRTGEAFLENAYADAIDSFM